MNPEGRPEASRQPEGRSYRRRGAAFVFLALGLAIAAYLSPQVPRDQHVRIVLGDSAPAVTGLALQYAAEDGEVARDVHFSYDAGAAPRIVSHEPRLRNGEYRLQIEIDARDGRRSVQRQVTLGGGSTQIDVSRP
jgi:hypothetical protein